MVDVVINIIWSLARKLSAVTHKRNYLGSRESTAILSCLSDHQHWLGQWLGAKQAPSHSPNKCPLIAFCIPRKLLLNSDQRTSIFLQIMYFKCMLPCAKFLYQSLIWIWITALELITYLVLSLKYFWLNWPMPWVPPNTLASVMTRLLSDGGWYWPLSWVWNILSTLRFGIHFTIWNSCIRNISSELAIRLMEYLVSVGHLTHWDRRKVDRTTSILRHAVHGEQAADK